MDQIPREPEPPAIVVFDVNIYLDIASLVGCPFSWERAVQIVSQNYSTQVPHPDKRIDSLRSVALTSSGTLIPTRPVQVWTSDHIDDLLVYKLTQDKIDGALPEDTGFGWTGAEAEKVVRDLLYRTVESSNGQSIGELRIPRSTPPLSHEDGLVCATGRNAYGGNELCDRFVVTRDRHFVESCETGYPLALHPSHFVQMVRTLRNLDAQRRMMPGRTNT